MLAKLTKGIPNQQVNREEKKWLKQNLDMRKIPTEADSNKILQNKLDFQKVLAKTQEL